jgi:hypothetical protein
MPFNANRGPVVQYEKEILRAFTGLESIKSMVVDSTKVAENPSSSGRYVLEAGTVMGKINGSSKICSIGAGAFGSGSSGAWVAADIVGILADKVEFYIGQGVTAGAATDEPVAVMFMGADFNINKLVAYTGNETITKAALPLCSFR